MTDFSPKRRAPQQLHQSAVPPPEAPVVIADVLPNMKQPAEAAEKPTKRRRRASVGSLALKLSAPSREGYTRRWVNDDGNRIANADELGYDHVSDTGLKTSGPGSRVSRLVGTKANGEPLHAYLMETPDELYAEGLAEKEAAARQIDESIKAGRDSTGQMSPNETYGHGSISSGS